MKVTKDIKSQINQKAGRDAYYYIDDVSLIETDVPIDTIIKPEHLTTNKISADKVLIFKTILFRTNEALLLPYSYPELDILAEYLKHNPQTTVDVSGHTDNSGNEKTNKKLSLQRAQAVSDYLISKDIDTKRIKHTGYGSSKAIVPNDTEEGKQTNRRVEFLITEK